MHGKKWQKLHFLHNLSQLISFFFAVLLLFLFVFCIESSLVQVFNIYKQLGNELHSKTTREHFVLIAFDSCCWWLLVLSFVVNRSTFCWLAEQETESKRKPISYLAEMRRFIGCRKFKFNGFITRMEMSRRVCTCACCYVLKLPNARWFFSVCIRFLVFISISFSNYDLDC